MGKLSCVVMVGFLALHISVILCIVAYSTPEWLIGNLSHNATHHNTTNGSHPVPSNQSDPVYSKGLWEYCISPKNCSNVNETTQPGWFKSVQGLDTAGVGLGMIALVVTYSVLLLDSCKNSAKASLLNVAVQLLAGATLLTALLIFGLRAKKDINPDEFPAEFDVKLGWSFIVDATGTALLILSSFMAVRGAVFYSRKQDGYEDI